MSVITDVIFSRRQRKTSQNIYFQVNIFSSHNIQELQIRPPANVNHPAHYRSSNFCKKKKRREHTLILTQQPKTKQQLFPIILLVLKSKYKLLHTSLFRIFLCQKTINACKETKQMKIKFR